jgi:hypothetical protein
MILVNVFAKVANQVLKHKIFNAIAVIFNILA